MDKSKEIPAFTKPVGSHASERSESFYDRSKNPAREHVNKNTGPGAGYKNVGKAATNPTQYPSAGGLGSERTDGMINRKNPTRDHVHKVSKPGGGYDQIGKGGASGAERKEGAFKKKPYTR